MNITVEKQPDCKATIRVEVPREKVESQRAEIAKLYHKSAALPGFRPGKAPAALIARRYSKQIEQELQDRLIGEGYREGSRKDGLEVLAPLDVKEPNFHDDGTFRFSVEVIVAPEFELPDYKGLTIKAPKIEVTEENVEQAIQELRERQAEYSTVEGRALAEGDIAVLAYDAFAEGRALREVAPDAPEGLQHGAGRWVRLQEPNFLPGFTPQLAGLNTGETRRVTVTLPEDFHVGVLAGKELTYEVTLTEIKEQALPEVDETFVRSTGLSDKVEGFRETVKQTLEAELRHRLDLHKRQQAVQALNDKVAFPVPENLVRQATQQRAAELVRANQQRGVRDEEIMEHQEDIFSAASQQAQYDVKTNFILNKIAEAEKIEATPDDIRQELIQHAVRSRITRPQLQKLAKDRQAIQRLGESIIVRKTLDLVVAHATVEESSPEEFEKALAAQQEAAEILPPA